MGAVMDGKFISYLRVSTDKQGRDGNGMAAQRKAVEDYLNGGRSKLMGEFIEVESGKRSDRPELTKAIADLMKRVDFVCCDRPNAKPFELHIYAALAQEERRMISERTKAGLQAAKERGVQLGGPNLAEMNTARQQAAVSRTQAIAPVLSEVAHLSARAAAAELNCRQIPTPTGVSWSSQTVIRARLRLSGVYGAN
jgi:DNA invertase Pin-like site-specific DNA recombinase